MGVFKKGDNWYIDYYVKGQRKRKRIGRSKKLALQVLQDVQLKIAKNEYLGIHAEKKVLLKEYVKQYLAFSEANKTKSSYTRDTISTAHLVSFFKGKYLFEINSQMIEKYKIFRLEKVGPASINRELACLKHMYTKAIEWGYIKENPAKNVKLLKEPPGRLRYLSPEEVERLLDNCMDHLRPIVLTAVNTGMRKREVLNLKWADVDLNNRKITVVNTKNNESRVIPINKTLYNDFLKLVKKVKSEYVFTDIDGKPYGDIKKSFASAVKNAKIENFRFHDLRHTFGSHLVMQGVGLRTVQQILGHKEIKMTMRYSHLSPEYVQKAVEKLDALWTLYGHQGKEREEEDIVTH
jgi:integrase